MSDAVGDADTELEPLEVEDEELKAQIVAQLNAIRSMQSKAHSQEEAVAAQADRRSAVATSTQILHIYNMRRALVDQVIFLR